MSEKRELLIGDVVRVTEGALPTRIVGCSGELVHALTGLKWVHDRPFPKYSTVTVALRGHKDFGRGENRYTVAAHKVTQVME